MNKPPYHRSLGSVLCTLLLAVSAASAEEKWPAGTSPAQVGKRVAENYSARKFQYENGRDKTVIYPEVITWYGALEIAKLTGDKDLQQRLIRRFDRFFTPEGAGRIPKRLHVDDHVFGALPLELYLLTKDEKYLTFGIRFADEQWEKPTPDGLTNEARYWVDDIYMISLLQAQAYRATGDKKYLDRAALLVATYLDKLQQPNGLVFHAEDSPFVWGRGCGWFAAGMTELLGELPKNHPKYARILEGYQKMMASLLKYQGENGLWRQLVDKPDAWAETSGTGMFAFAMVAGVKRGWLDEKNFGPAARKAWLALVSELDAGGNLKNVCIMTSKGMKAVGPDLEKQLGFYLARGRATGDLHGQAPILWTAAALLR